MSQHTSRLLVTGASGQLGALVIEALLQRVSAEHIVATARDTASLATFAKRNIDVRYADYDRPDTLDQAFAGIERILLISSSEIGRRVPQHRNVIAAAKRAGVTLLAYTSVLHAERSPLALAEEHRATETALRTSDLPWVVLRNGWYTENYTAALPSVLAHGAVLGSAGEGKLSTASRADYAAAAAAVLADPQTATGQLHELAGDQAFTLTDYAAEITRQSGVPVVYRNLPETDYRQALIQAGLPEPLAAILAQSDAAAAQGALFDESGTLRRLIDRPTTPWRDSIAHALAKARHGTA